MRLWRDRPLFLWCCAFMAASMVGFFLAAWAKLTIIAVTLTGTLLGGGAAVRFRKRRYGMVILAVACLAATMGMGSSYAYFDMQEREISSLIGEDREVRGTVVERGGSGGHLSTYTLQLTSVDGEAVSVKALLTCYYAADLQVGYDVQLLGEITDVSAAAMDDSRALDLLSEGMILGVVSQSEDAYTVVSDQGEGLWVALARYRDHLAGEFDHFFGDGAGGLPSALLLGERDGIPDHVRAAFRRAGISHLLAISGLHMTLLFGALERLLKRLRLSPRLRAAVLFPIAAGYLVFLGFPASATRAIIALGMVYLSHLFGMGADTLTSLGIAGALILLCDPPSVLDVGFWMSFSAAFGLVILSLLWKETAVRPSTPGEGWCRRAVRRMHRWGRKGFAALATGVTAMTFSLWITVGAMGTVSVLSPLTTLIFTPVVGAVLVGALMAVCLWSTPIGAALSVAVTAMCRWMIQAAELLADIPGTVISMREPIQWAVILGMTVMLLLLLAVRLPRRRWLILPVVIGWTLLSVVGWIMHASDQGQVTVTYLQPSSAAEMLVLTQGRDAVICDLSNGSYSSLREGVWHAQEMGATELRALVMTHYHRRAAGALGRILSENHLGSLWLPQPNGPEDAYVMQACMDAAAVADVPIVIYENGQAMHIFGEGNLRIQWAELDRSEQAVLMMTLDAHRDDPTADTLVWLSGAVFESSLKEAAVTAARQSEYLLFGKHGPTVHVACPADMDTSRAVWVGYADSEMAAWMAATRVGGGQTDYRMGQACIRLGG